MLTINWPVKVGTRDSDLEEFFKHENWIYPPALSHDGQLRFGTKAHLLEPLELLVNQRLMHHKSLQ